jgi:hypothetical protein
MSHTVKNNRPSSKRLPRLLPLKKAAEYLGVTTWAMRELAWSGSIPVVRFNGQRKQYFDIHDLEDLIRENKERIE